MARHFQIPEEGTPERTLYDAVDSRFPRMIDFFRKVAEAASVDAKSASGTFYAVLRGRRSLPKEQRRAYIDLLDIEEATLHKIEAKRIVRSNVVSINRPDVALLEEAIALLKEIREIQARIERVAAQVLAHSPEAPAEDPPDNHVAEGSSPQ